MGKLTILGAKSAKPGRHADGDGLYLLVKPSGARSWILRVQADGRRRDIGLGSLDVVARRDNAEEIPILHRRQLTLTEAREKSGILRRIAHGGLDPIAERDKDRAPVPSFERAAIACHGDLKRGWSPKSAAAFLSSLQDHVFPTMGSVRVDRVEASHIREMLAPIWMEIPQMARKVRQRVGIVLNYAKAKGWRSSEAPGRAVTMGLARHAAAGNFAAMPYQDVPAFVAELSGKTETVGRLALLFAVHTAARSGEVRRARWGDIDPERRLWNRPAALMKSKAAHSVTLTGEALRVLDRAADHRGSDGDDALIFPGNTGAPLSDMTLSKIMRDAKVPFTVHGFRSSFRDFAAEQMPTIPDAVAEAALAHLVPDKVERAYKRTKFLEMRRTLLEAWAQFLAGESNVLRLAVAEVGR